MAACSSCGVPDPSQGCTGEILQSGSTVSFCSPIQTPLPNPLPDDIPATDVIAAPLATCPNGNPVKVWPPASCGETSIQEIVSELEKAVYCVLNALTIGNSQGSCQILMAVNGAVKLKTLGDAIAECWTNQPPAISCTSIKSALTKDGCIPSGSLAVAIGYDAGGALKYAPFPNPDAPNCSRFIQEFKLSANGGCVSQDATPASFGIGAASNGNLILRPLAAANNGGIICSDLLAKIQTTSAGGCLPTANDAVTSVISVGPSGVAYRPLPASSGGSGVSCSTLVPLMKSSANGGCFAIATETKPSHIFGLNSSGTPEYFSDCAVFLASLKRGPGGCVPDSSAPQAVLGADLSGDPKYMLPLPLYHLEVWAGGASSNVQSFIPATYNNLNNVTTLWNTAQVHETGLRGSPTAWGGGATGTWTAPRAMRVQVNASLFGRARASGGAALLNHAYMGITIVRAAGTASGQPTFSIATVYRFVQMDFYADNIDHDMSGSGAVTLEVNTGDRIWLRAVITNSPSAGTTAQSLNARDDGATMLTISELPSDTTWA